jgi:hypothetical protein
MRLPMVSLALCGLLVGCSSSSWRAADFSLNECVHRAKLAMRDSDFTERLHVVGNAGGQGVLGRHGSYWAEIDCSLEQRTVNVAVTGPDPELTGRYKDSITRRF